MFLAQHKLGAALITGAAKRVGSYIAKVVASNNYDIIIHYNNSKEEALTTKKQIETHYPVKAQVLQCDLLKHDSIKNFVESAFSIFPHLNVLINNASVFKKCNFVSSTEEVFDVHMNIHLKAPFFLLQEFCRKKISFNVINLLDEDVSKNSCENYFSYLLAKKAMLTLGSMTEDILAKNNSRVNSIMPGRILDMSSDCAKNFFILQAAIKYLLHTKESGLKIHI